MTSNLIDYEKEESLSDSCELDLKQLNWIWLLNNTEKEYFHNIQSKNKKAFKYCINQESYNLTSTYAKQVSAQYLDEFKSFIPKIIARAINNDIISNNHSSSLVVELQAIVLFIDASGFTKISEIFAKDNHGAEKLGIILNKFMNCAIQIIDYWGGDVIKFAGDALTVIWPVANENYPAFESLLFENPTTACSYAIQCCNELHANLDHFATGILDSYFDLHIGAAFGQIILLTVGGINSKYDFVVAGEAIKQIALAEPLAKPQETVITNTVYNLCFRYIDTEKLNEENAIYQFYKILGVRKIPKMPPDSIYEFVHKVKCTSMLQFIPDFIITRINMGLTYFLNELRYLSIVFVGITDYNIVDENGCKFVSKLMTFCQICVNVLEGNINKFSVDDKGIVILLIFGAAPLHHTDDPMRAALCGLRFCYALRKFGLSPKIGIATGHVWTGLVGCDIRKEYTCLGDTVNFAARLMGLAKAGTVYIDLHTKNFVAQYMQTIQLPSQIVKGKVKPVEMYTVTGVLYLQTTKLNYNIMKLPEWPIIGMIQNMAYSKFKYRPFIMNFDKPAVGLKKTKHGTTYPWNYYEPWLPALKEPFSLGGVCILKGNNYDGIEEASYFLEKLLEYQGMEVLSCSNLPKTCYLPVSNIPHYAFRILCTKILQRWLAKGTSIRKKNKLELNNSNYTLIKELLHPSLHLYLSTKNDLFNSLFVPYKAADANLNNSSLAKKLVNCNLTMNKKTMSAIIISLLNGFTKHFNTVVLFNLKHSTSHYGYLEPETWKVLLFLAEYAMFVRRLRLEQQTKELIQWRMTHSQNCNYCKGNTNAEAQSNCKPCYSPTLFPFTLIIKTSERTNDVEEQQVLENFARECGLYTEINKCNIEDLKQICSNFFHITTLQIPKSLTNYINALSLGQIYLIIFLIKRIQEHMNFSIRQDKQDKVKIINFNQYNELKQLSKYRSFSFEQQIEIIRKLRCYSPINNCINTYKFTSNNVCMKACNIEDVCIIYNSQHQKFIWSYKSNHKADNITYAPGPLDYSKYELSNSFSQDFSALNAINSKTSIILDKKNIYSKVSLRELSENFGLTQVGNITSFQELDELIKNKLATMPIDKQLMEYYLSLYEDLPITSQVLLKCASVFDNYFDLYLLIATYPIALDINSVDKLLNNLIGKNIIIEQLIDNVNLSQSTNSTYINQPIAELQDQLSRLEINKIYGFNSNGRLKHYKFLSLVFKQTVINIMADREITEINKIHDIAIKIKNEYGIIALINSILNRYQTYLIE